jgi:enoyl-CoA hydratase/carnithine racemase
MIGSELLVETHGPVTRLVMNRPQAMNALNLAMLDRFRAELPGWRKMLPAVFSSAGRGAFAGADLKPALSVPAPAKRIF